MIHKCHIMSFSLQFLTRSSQQDSAYIIERFRAKMCVYLGKLHPIIVCVLLLMLVLYTC